MLFLFGWNRMDIILHDFSHDFSNDFLHDSTHDFLHDSTHDFLHDFLHEFSNDFLHDLINARFFARLLPRHFARLFSRLFSRLWPEAQCLKLRVVQFWSEIKLVIASHTPAPRTWDFVITRLISDQIALHSVQLPSYTVSATLHWTVYVRNLYICLCLYLAPPWNLMFRSPTLSEQEAVEIDGCPFSAPACVKMTAS